MRSAIALALLLLAIPALRGQSPRGVEDGADLFTEATVEDANGRIEAIKNKFGFDLYIETIEELPAADAKKIEGLKHHAVVDKLHEIAEDRADALRQRSEKEGEPFSGVYVLVVVQPASVTVTAWPGYNKNSWYSTSFSLQRLVNPLEKALPHTKSDKDAALLHGLREYRKHLDDRQPAPESPLRLWRGMAVVGGLAGLWLLLSFIRRQALGHPEPIYQPAVLGSAFGIPAGHWVNDRLFQLERPAPVVLAATTTPPDHPQEDPGLGGEPPAPPGEGEKT